MPVQFNFPFPQPRSADDDPRAMFGRGPAPGGGVSGGFKMRMIMALVVALFAVISYYGKPGEVNPVTGDSEHVALSSVNDEIQLGLQAAPEMAGQHGGPSRSTADQLRVEIVGKRLLAGLQKDLDNYNRQHPGEHRENPYRQAFQYTLLADPDTVNAFALPGGQVFITEGLYHRLKTEGQLAGVLGHETGHVLSRHGNKQMAKQGLLQGLAGAVGVLGGDQQSARMAQMVSSVVGMKYGRDDELEADHWGVRLAPMAGYDPHAMIEVMKILDAVAGAGGQPEYLSTHPNPGHRIEHIEDEIQADFPNGVPAGLEP